MNAKIHIILDVPDYLFKKVPDYLLFIFNGAFDY